MAEKYEIACQSLLSRISDPYILFAIEHIESFATLPLTQATSLITFLEVLYQGSKDESLDIFLLNLVDSVVPLNLESDQVLLKKKEKNIHVQ